MEVSTETIRKTMEVGYLAATRGMAGEAITIFEGIAAVRPESEFPDVGLSFAYLCAGDSAEAMRILTEQALAKNPESELSKSFIGLCLKQAGMNAEADSVLHEVVEGGSDKVAQEMAAALLLETFSQ